MASVAAEAGPAPASIEDFARLAEVDKARLSPTGEFVAALLTKDDQTALVIFKTADRSVVSGLKLAFGDSVVNYEWSGPKEVVAEVGSSDGPLGEVVGTGELMVLDAEPGASSRYLIGWRGKHGTTGSRVRTGGETDVNAFAEVIDPTPDNGQTMLIALHEWGTSLAEPPVALYEINSKTSKRRRIAIGPKPYCDFVFDAKEVLRFATCWNPKAEQEVELYRFKGNESDWERIALTDVSKLVPWFVTRDNKWAYFSAVGLKGSPSDAACLARQPLDGSAALSVVSCQAGHAVQRVLTSADDTEAIAAYYDTGAPLIDFVESQHPDGELLLALQKSFGSQLVFPVSASRDGLIWLLEVGSDKRSPAYYIFNRKTNDASKLFERYPSLAKSPMRPVEAVQFAARDGEKVNGYLTLPAPVGATKPPLVVLPHGGPFGIRDSWGFDAESQLLASRGYAVLRVNFRGSGGYGRKFSEAGRFGWGTVMIDDLTDAVRHVIAKGQVDANRVGIYGGSYGGYAALMSAVREPNLYKAAVVYAGLVDLNQWKEDSDVGEGKSGRSHVDRYIGRDKEALRKQSPIEYIAQLKAPVMIIHGEADRRVPYSQAKILRSALDKRNHPYEWLTKYDEGHGFYRFAARKELYTKLLSFLDRNLKAAK